MKYLSIDIEATGLREDDYIIEFAAIAFDTETMKVYDNLTYHTLVKCPPYEELVPKLDDWVKQHNKNLIQNAHEKGISLVDWKTNFELFLKRKDVVDFFGKQQIILFGKSMNAIDLPFMNRDLGWGWMREYFSHRTVDFTGVCYGLMDLSLLPQGSERGSLIMKHLGFGAVAHNALDDAKNTALMYLKVLSKNYFLPQ